MVTRGFSASGLDVPAAVVVPAADRVVPVRDQLALAGTVTGAQVFMTPGGHSAAIEHPESFVPTLIDACREVAGRLRGVMAPPRRGHAPPRRTPR